MKYWPNPSEANSMTYSMTKELEIWEDDGGADPEGPSRLTGSPAQVEWAERIRLQVLAEFVRVAAALETVARNHPGDQRAETGEILKILQAKRLQTMSRREAGYFIHDWQEISSQVRQLIFEDPNYQAILVRRRLRQRG